MDTQTIKQFSDNREARAKVILEKGNPSKIDEFTYLVPSQTTDRKYKVTHIDAYSCECEDFKKRCQGNGLYCKHIKAIVLFEKLKNTYELEATPIKKEVEMIIDVPQNDNCPYCKSGNIFKRGVRKTIIGEKQLYCCKECKRRFVLEPIKHIKGNAKLVCLAMDCYYKGLSYRDISDQFKQFYGLSISHVAVRDWVLKFSKIMDKYAKTIKPKTAGDVWNADETMVRTKKAKNDYEYQWNVIDRETKFIMASSVSGHTRSIKDAKKVMTEAYEQSGEVPNEIITDRQPSYVGGIRKAFRNWGQERKVKHIPIVGKRKIINNNAIENLHTHQKEFQKIRRGINEVQTYADGFKTFHNFIRKGVEDKQTPAERCGIGVLGNNRWYPMLINSVNSAKKATDLTGEEKTAESH